jgi:hypothetical protein
VERSPHWLLPLRLRLLLLLLLLFLLSFPQGTCFFFCRCLFYFAKLGQHSALRVTALALALALLIVMTEGESVFPVARSCSREGAAALSLAGKKRKGRVSNPAKKAPPQSPSTLPNARSEGAAAATELPSSGSPQSHPHPGCYPHSIATPHTLPPTGPPHPVNPHRLCKSPKPRTTTPDSPTKNLA